MSPPRIRLLLLDANAVIELHRLGLWSKVQALCDIHLARTVAEREADYYFEEGHKIAIDLAPAINAGSITVHDVPLAITRKFLSRFPRTFAQRLDPGELESLAHLVEVDGSCLISSSDIIVWRALGFLGLGDQGLSLEDILKRCGLGRTLDDQYTEAFRKHWIGRGAVERIQV